MASRISLALTFHNHQPIGNFGWVLEDVCDRAYQPLVDTLFRHPGISAGLHYTGPLLEWLERERPALLDRIVELAGRGQVELLGGGLHEPILVALAEVDRREQLLRMADRIQALTGVRPRGAWLAERVWEPDLPGSLADSGYDWTIVDDAHLRAAALPDDAAWGPWMTEDQGRQVAVFATDQWLRYRIPFGTVDAVIERLRGAATEAGDRLATMGDDGEKFGAWPKTAEHCWGSGQWVDRFFEAIEANTGWLATVTPSAWLDEHAPLGLAYIPSASYAEMGEWAMPADESLAFAKALHDAVEAGRPETRWLRGASWRSFLVKYCEANDAHKQMLRASAAVHSMAPGPERDRAIDHLHRGQSNDSYWHGLFGGLYLADLRVAALSHLIAAQDAADRAAADPPVAAVADLDLDGRPDVLLADAAQVVTVDLDEGAGIGAWDLRAARHPVAGVLRRRPEAYHAKLRELEATASRAAQTATADAAKAVRDPGAPATIHELLAAKEQNLSSRLHYDDHERRLGLVRFFAPGVSPDAVAAGEATDLGDFVDRPFSVVELGPGRLVVARDGRVDAGGGALPVRVAKAISLGGDRRSPTLTFEVSVDNRSDDAFDARLGLEIPTMLLGGGGNPAAWWDVDGRRTSHDSSGTAAGVSRLAQGNDYLGISIETLVSPPAEAWWAPIETVSNSESGFERAYQGSSLLLSWPRRFGPGERFGTTVRLAAEVAHDRAEDET